MPKLSSITITANEADNIADCIDSLNFCDERIVVDSGSKDETVAIAEKHGATVYYHPWTDFGRQKNIVESPSRRIDFTPRTKSLSWTSPKLLVLNL
jgi:glycosyltransferase involved in cell wall biosynthesis